jgi:hypothetical protein
LSYNITIHKDSQNHAAIDDERYKPVNAKPGGPPEHDTIQHHLRRSNPIHIWDMGSLNIKRLANQTVEGTLRILAFFLEVRSKRPSLPRSA